ncbi:MAG: hypothetical protein CM15mP12_0510 [Gammaproteobacteria bacterium]|nr:MAG: hypothetical protein CM15mP12_0510 [Gammaproteobacteria bacterium]
MRRITRTLGGVPPHLILLSGNGIHKNIPILQNEPEHHPETELLKIHFHMMQAWVMLMAMGTLTFL